MSDRHKFRVWDKQTNQYVNFEDGRTFMFLDQQGELYLSHTPGWTFDDLTQVEDNRYVVQHNTGLKDINGKLIYEGDIVIFEKSSKTGRLRKGVVQYYTNYCYFLVIVEENGWGRPFNTIPDRQYLEVIGNIYENKELLNELLKRGILE